MLDYVEEVGKYFGYPSCCINAYKEIQSKAGRKTAEQSFVAAQNGGSFIPCHAHATQVLEGKITLKSLIQNRICTLPFPQEPPMSVVDEYISGALVA
jgi:hypothetical protein